VLLLYCGHQATGRFVKMALESREYAVRYGTGLVLRYVEFDGGRLILRPLSPTFPVQLLALGPQETPANYIVGRVCLVISEL
jgi:hypothetical protein